MKFNNLSEEKEIKSNLSGESFTSEISDPKLMMLIVRDKLYSHKLRTPIQEYISNAIDAQREANTTHIPIKIVLPTELEPVLKIRDYGTGMSVEKVRKTFSQYTASDKTNNLNVIGGYGLGSKSAFAYTDKFTIVSYINGEMHSYLAYAPSELDLIFTPLFQGPTQEENGVEIQIAIKPNDFDKARNAVLRLAYLMEVKPNIINCPDFSKQYDDFKNSLAYSNDYFRIYRNAPSVVKNQIADSYPGIFINYNGIPYSNVKNHSELTTSAQKGFNAHPFFIELIAKPNSLSVPPAREMLTEDEKYTEFLSLIDTQLKEWNAKLFKEEVEKLHSVTSFDEFDTFFSNRLFNHKIKIPLKISNKEVVLAVSENKTILELKESLGIVKRKVYRGVAQKTSTFHALKYYPESTPTEAQSKATDFKAEDYKEQLVRLEYPLKNTAILRIDSLSTSLHIEQINKTKHYFEANPSIVDILLVTKNSCFYEQAEMHLNDVQKKGNGRDLIEYYTYEYSSSHDATKSRLIQAQAHFNTSKSYKYLVIEPGTKHFPMERWVYENLTKLDARLIFITESVAKVLEKRKKFSKVNLEEELSKNPQGKITEDDIQIIAFNRFFKINKHYYDKEIRLYSFLQMRCPEHPISKLVEQNQERYNKLEASYNLSLVHIEKIERTYYSFDKESFPLVSKLLGDIKTFLHNYPLIALLADSNVFLNISENNHLGEVLEYMKYKDKTRAEEELEVAKAEIKLLEIDQIVNSPESIEE